MEQWDISGSRPPQQTLNKIMTSLVTHFTPTLPRFSTYFRVWSIQAGNELQQAFINRFTNIFFVVGKLLRLGMSLLFLFVLRKSVPTFANYTTDQMIVFFLTYQIIDVVTQVLFRGVYSFGDKVKTGEFDFLLTKPINALFQTLTGKPDVNDAIF